MKYIRTKDGKIFEYGGRIRTLYGDIISISGQHFRYDCVLNEANTIEELCDERVAVIDGQPPLLEREFWNDEANREKYESFEQYVSEEKGSLFNAIWTSIGLIYVAIMSGKGELELI